MKQKGFTLVELLVVISIISLLASVVLASLNSARDKGRIGAARYFAAQVDHIASEQAVAIWDFDECSGTTAADRSGYGNTGTLTAGAVFSTDTPTGKGCSVDLTAANRYVNGGNDLSVRGMNGSFTVMGWIKITTTHCYNLIFSNDQDVGSGANGFALGVYCGNQTLFRVWNNTRTSLTGPNLNNSQWYHMAGVYDGASMKLYVDGIQVASNTYSGGLGAPASYTNTIGNLGNCNTCAPHGLYVDNVAIYAKALTASEIGKVYALQSSGSVFAKK